MESYLLWSVLRGVQPPPGLLTLHLYYLKSSCYLQAVFLFSTMKTTKPRKEEQVQIPRLRQWREARALTQEELAAKAGISPRSVAGYEAGAGARPGTVRSLAAVLNIDVMDLLEDYPKAQAPLTPAWAVSSQDKAFRRELAGATTEDLRLLVKGMVGNQEAQTLEEARERLRDHYTRVITFERARQVREELLQRGDEPPEDYLPDFDQYLRALGFK
jgi:transcriptional regulator with XRE-family HTH domain